MHIIVYNPSYQLSWVDDDKTILQLDIHPGWTWDDGQAVLKHINQQISFVEHDVYMIYNFTYRAKVMTRHFSTRNVKTYLEHDMPNERMVYIIGADSILATLIRTLAGLYSYISENAEKVRFMNSLDETYTHINKTKQAQPIR